MFTLIDQPEFTHDVTVVMPADGGFTEHTFKARFKLLPADEIEKFPMSQSFSAVNATFLREVIVRLDDLQGEDKELIPYSDDLRDRVLKSPPAQMALMQTYLTAISKVKQGN